jgi:hypothetical protein
MLQTNTKQCICLKIDSLSRFDGIPSWLRQISRSDDVAGKIQCKLPIRQAQGNPECAEGLKIDN